MVKQFISHPVSIFRQEMKQSGKDTSLIEDQINQMVYKLYGLSDDEITLVKNT